METGIYFIGENQLEIEGRSIGEYE